MSTEFKRVRDYELMVVFHPELSEEDLVSESDKVEGHITAVDGTIRLVNREAPWGRRRLSYPIRHDSRDVRDGVYVLYYFTSESGKLSEIEREIKLQDRILRYLLTQQSAPIMEPTPTEGEETAGADETSSTEGAAPTEVVATDSPVVEAQPEDTETVADGAEQVAVTSQAAADAEPDVAVETADEQAAPETSEETPA